MNCLLALSMLWLYMSPTVQWEDPACFFLNSGMSVCLLIQYYWVT